MYLDYNKILYLSYLSKSTNGKEPKLTAEFKNKEAVE